MFFLAAPLAKAIMWGGTLMMGKNLYDASQQQIGNLDDAADKERTFADSTLQSALTQLDSSLSGHQALIEKWEGAGFGMQIGRMFMDIIAPIFGQKSVTEQLNNAHQEIAQAEETRLDLKAQYSTNMDTLEQQNIVRELGGKIGETLGIGETKAEKRGRSLSSSVDQDESSLVNMAKDFGHTVTFGLFKADKGELTSAMNNASNVVTMPENELGNNGPSQLPALDFNR